jgi:hypothetical protein
MSEQKSEQEQPGEEREEAPTPRFPELEELQQEVERRIRDNQRFLDNFLKEDYLDEDEEPDDEEENFEEL